MNKKITFKFSLKTVSFFSKVKTVGKRRIMILSEEKLRGRDQGKGRQ
jgi:hypothetical protein